jgi:hypothetical protein
LSTHHAMAYTVATRNKYIMWPKLLNSV